MGQELKPGWVKVNLLKLMDRIFGDTFTIKFFEPREDFGSKELRAIQKEIPEVRTILAEEEHEKPLNGLNR